MRPILSAAGVIGVCLLGPIGARGDESLVERFRREYPDAARRLVAAAVGVGGSGKVTFFEPGQETVVAGFRFAVDKGYQKLEQFAAPEPTPTARPSYVACVWERSGYELNWSPEAKAYQVTHSGPFDRVGTPFLYYNLQLGRFLAAPFSVCAINLPEALAQAETTVVAVTPSKVAGRDCLRIQLRKSAEKNPMIAADVTADLDPARGWIVLAGEMQTGGILHCRQENAYMATSDGRLRIREVKINEDYDPNIPEAEATRYRCEFAAIEPRAIPLTEFSLSRYGVKPIVGPGSDQNPAASEEGRSYARTGLMATLGLLGVVVVIGGIWVVRKTRRPRS